MNKKIIISVVVMAAGAARIKNKNFFRIIETFEQKSCLYN